MLSVSLNKHFLPSSCKKKKYKSDIEIATCSNLRDCFVGFLNLDLWNRIFFGILLYLKLKTYFMFIQNIFKKIKLDICVYLIIRAVYWIIQAFCLW